MQTYIARSNYSKLIEKKFLLSSNYIEGILKKKNKIKYKENPLKIVRSSIKKRKKTWSSIKKRKKTRSSINCEIKPKSLREIKWR